MSRVRDYTKSIFQYLISFSSLLGEGKSKVFKKFNSHDGFLWAEICSIFIIQNFVKPHKISAFYLGKQKSFGPKKVGHVSNHQDFKMQNF